MLSLSFGEFKIIEGCCACAGKRTAAFTSTLLTAEYGLKFWIDLEGKKVLVTCCEIRHASWKVGFGRWYPNPVPFKYKKDPPLVPPPHSQIARASRDLSLQVLWAYCGFNWHITVGVTHSYFLEFKQWWKESGLVGKLLCALVCPNLCFVAFLVAKDKLKASLDVTRQEPCPPLWHQKWRKHSSLGCYQWDRVYNPAQQGWMFAEVPMPICSRASKKPWPGSEVSLVTKNVHDSLKIFMCITLSTFHLSRLHQGFKAVFCGGKRKFEYINCRKFPSSPFSKLTYPFLPT